MTTTEPGPFRPGLAVGRFTPAVAIAVALVGLLPTDVRAQDEGERTWWSGALVAGTGVEYSSGGYGDSKRTNIWDVPFSAKYIFEEIGFGALDEVEFKVTIPYRRVQEPDFDCFGGPNEDAEDRDDPDICGRERGSGIGDLAVRFGYFHVPRSKRWPIVGGLFRIRFNTAENNVGGGSTTFTAALDVSNSYELGDGDYPRITPFGRVGYRFSGSAPSRERDNSLQTSVGAVFRPIWDFGIGVAYDYGGSTSGGNARHEISPFLTWRVNRHLRFGPYGVYGISENSVDYALGMSIRVSLDVEGRREVPIRAGGQR